MGSSRSPGSGLLLVTASALGLALALSGCAPASPTTPSPASTESELFSAEDGVRSSAQLFFSLLAAADEKGAAEELTPAVSFAEPITLLLTPLGVYGQIEDRPKIRSVDDVSVSNGGKSGTATVTYEMADTEHTDTLRLKLKSDDEVGADEYAVVIPDEGFGLDASGVERLPADTVYRIHGVDVSEAFLAARALADGGEVPRIPAFGGTYPLEITVPGTDGFTGTVTLQMSGVVDGTGTDGVLSAFLSENGF